MGQNQPINDIRLGCIRAAIWENEKEDGAVWFNVTLSRLYKEGSQWKDAASFRRDDLPIVAKVLDMAYDWIWRQNRVESEQEA